MSAVIVALGPLIISIGGFLIKLLVQDLDAQAQATENLKAWVNANKNDSAQSANLHLNYQSQLEELVSSLPPQEQALIRSSGRNLKMGDAGPMVELLQNMINAVGYQPAIVVDFDFGVTTDKAVRALQAKYSLAVDGTVDWAFWVALQKDLSK